MTASRTAGPAVLTTVRVTSALAVLILVVQGVTAGDLIAGVRAAETWHAVGAIVVHVLTGLAAIAAFAYLRAPRWPVIVAVVVFVVSFVQAALGSGGVMVVHVPLAMILLLGSAAVLVWSLTTRRAVG